MAKKQQHRLVVLITGCARGGIGEWYSRHFHARGCRVYASDVQPVSSMQNLDFMGIRTLQLDVTSDESVTAAVSNIIRTEGRIDILVNNAGVSHIGPLAELPLSKLKHNFDVNLFGTVRLIQAVVPFMAERKQGRIVNVGSVVGFVPTPWAASYCSSKAAVHAVSDVLRLELEPLGIKVILVAPGSVRSGFGAAAADSLKESEWKMYRGFSGAIAERAVSSQSSRATEANVFAKKVVEEVLKPVPAKHFAYGCMSGLFKVLRWSPLWVRDEFMRKRFGLVNEKQKFE